MLWIIHCDDRDDGAPAIRAAMKEDHFAYLHAHEGILVFGGALLADDGVARLGSVFLVNLPNRAAVDDFMLREPFRKAELFKNVTITRLRKGHFHPAAAPTTAEGD
jgi:uncharacterized protein YciI